MSEWSTPATIISLLSMLGVGYLAPKAWQKIAQAFTSRSRRERAEVDRLRTELTEARAQSVVDKARADAAEDETDIEAAWRRRLQEALSQTRIVAAEHGVPVDKLPAFPGRPEPA